MEEPTHLEQLGGSPIGILALMITDGAAAALATGRNAWRGPFRFHDLRHTANALTAASGASTKELMHRMGHASSQAAIRYQHATRERDASLARALGELVEASRGIARDNRGMDAVEGLDDGPSLGDSLPVTSTSSRAGDENRTRVLSLGS